MGKGRKLFDIRSLFEQNTASRYDGEEDEIYTAIEEKRKRKIKDPKQRILSREEVEALGKMDIEEATSRHIPSWKGIEEVEMDGEQDQENNEWKTHVLRNLLKKNRLNVDARIRLSRLVGRNEGSKILLEGRDIKDERLWREIISRYYASDMLDEALEVVDGDEGFYEDLFRKDRDIKILRAGVSRHPRSFGLRKMMSENLEDILEKQMFLYESVVETHEERLVDLFIGTKPNHGLVESLYRVLRDKGIYSEHLLSCLVEDGDNSMVVEDLLRLGLEGTLRILRRGKRRVELPSPILSKDTLLLYLQGERPEPMSALPSDLWSLFVSMSKHGLHDDETFISCYNVAKEYFLDSEFIERFFVMEPRRYFVDLMKAKEWWKLFVGSKEIGYFRRAEKILRSGMRQYGREKKTFILARSKMYYMGGDFHSSYSVIPGKMRTIRKYVILSQISLERAFEELGKDLFDYKHWLLYAELGERRGIDASGIYEECMSRYPENFKVGIGYLRYLKRKDMKKALEMSDKLAKRFMSEEWMWFERFVIFRKLGKISLSVLYNSRRHVRSELIESEIKYYENKEISEESKYSGFYAYRRARIKECNIGGMCLDCVGRMKEYYREKIMKDQDNGDNYILYYCVGGGVDGELVRMVEFFDPRGGSYWPRVRNRVDVGSKLEAGWRMMNFDFLDKTV
ncbi:uncharacterized protein Eint_081000 [Encephalitozoon intestinalis ATCC 50506]|uniref:Uncharacterized protein n=1 Tax=Encephalitozoon intestinalis (strain ATCC 50506) TaxID=876142 RepID=E0S8P9_ENCIT|nr:uncharacterized protein Eint_081000 [Encephalitozoon intestinalis ATCC 50506]ADM12032.1 hypothetical protein Eint_081000 [Encephalitozoon intestinalis ATCC 50506]UTX45820.1 hypothetical protein GPK93_08g13990 [Encephalitozoon intestinalis]